MWVAPSVKRPTLGLGSGHDLGIVGLSPESWSCGLALGMESA